MRGTDAAPGGGRTRGRCAGPRTPVRTVLPALLASAALLALLALPAPPAGAAGAGQAAARGSAAATAPATAAADSGQSLAPLQESMLLRRVVSAFPPADGLLRVSAGVRLFSLERLQPRQVQQVDHRDWFLETEYSPLPFLHLLGRLPYRTWTGGEGEVPPTGSGLGDLQALAAVPLPTPAGWLGLVAAGGASLPTGDERLGLSEGRTVPSLLLAAGLRLWHDSWLPELALHLNAGWRWNAPAGHGVGPVYQPWPPLYPAVAGGDDRDNDFLLLGAAVEMRRGPTRLYLEYSEARLPGADAVAFRERQRFLTAGLTWGRRQGPSVRLAYDVSLTRDDLATDYLPVIPDLVTSVSVGWQFGVGGRDRDGDGIPDRDDLCPRRAEDRDGYRDADGCPDPDNDGDGVLDDADLCPDTPEDRDGYLDEDGCPDLDNDGDGIPDAVDACPDLAEDFDGEQDDDGCPEVLQDRDGDGVPDRVDRCPDRPEDRDGFEDEDGCPELDNDLDGLPDARDACPDQAEDYDGFEDDDGCPEGGPDGGSGP